jgi:SAM-dependent methyltransferase
MLAATRTEGKPLRLARFYVKHEPRSVPRIDQRAVDVERASLDLTQLPITGANEELSVRVAHRHASGAAPARLHEHDRAAPVGAQAVTAARRNEPSGLSSHALSCSVTPGTGGVTRYELGRIRPGLGERAADWAYLVEPYARRVNEALFDQLGVGPGTRLLDIACGSGYAANLAAGRGAVVSGLDASQALIAIARARTPEADFRIGDMFALPFEDGSFDVATSFNGIWKGCEQALIEARRVLRPGGLIGFTFWGSPKRLGLLPYFATLAELSPPDHIEATLTQGDTGRPGVAEQMLADAGLRLIGRGREQAVNELPDLDLTVRALAAAGPSWPAVRHAGPERFAEVMREALRPLYSEGTGVRIVSEFGWIVGQVP